MAKKQKKDDGPPGAPAWMMTFGDMVTLVLTFFVLLVSMMVVDPKKFVEFLGTYKDTYGEGHDRKTEDKPVKTEDYFTQIIRVSSRTEQRDGGQMETMEGEAVRVFAFKQNYVVKMAAAPFFENFEVMLTESGRQQLRLVAKVLNEGSSANRIQLRGHYSQNERSFDNLKEEYEQVNGSMSTDERLDQKLEAIVRVYEEFDPNRGEWGEMVPRVVFLNGPGDLALYRARAVQEYLLYLLRGPQGSPFSEKNFEAIDAGYIRNTPVRRANSNEPKIVRGREAHRDDFTRLGKHVETTVMEDAAENLMLEAPMKNNLALVSWPNFIFVEGGNDFGRTVEIVVTGEIIGDTQTFRLPIK